MLPALANFHDQELQILMSSKFAVHNFSFMVYLPEKF